MLNFFFPWKSLQVDHAVHFQTVIFKSGEADPCIFSKDITVFSPSPKKTLQILGELMAINSTIIFVSILNLQIIKRRMVVLFERKEGKDFTWLWRRWLREVVLWSGKAPQSRYISLAFISGKGEILGLSSGNPCWLREMALCWADCLGFQFVIWLLWINSGIIAVRGRAWRQLFATIAQNTCPDRKKAHLRPGMTLLRSEQIPYSRDCSDSHDFSQAP